MIVFRSRRACCALLLALLPVSGNGAEEFERVSSFGVHSRFLEPDARAIAMGTASTAIAKGPTAAFWNLGALGLPGSMGGLSYSTREVGVRYHFLSVSGGWRGIGIGGHFTGMRDRQDIRTIFDPSGVRNAEVSHYFGLVGAGIDMGRYVAALPEGMEWGSGLGIALARNKVISFEGDGWDMDLGTVLSWRLPLDPSRGATALVLRTGYVLRNIWNRSMDIEGATIRLGRQDRMGLAATMELACDSRFGPLYQGTVSWERRGLLYDWGGANDQIGGEITVAGILSLRTGRIWDESGSGDDVSNWGVGLGLEPGNPLSPRVGAQLDYVEAEQNIGPDFDQFTASIWVVL